MMIISPLSYFGIVRVFCLMLSGSLAISDRKGCRETTRNKSQVFSLSDHIVAVGGIFREFHHVGMIRIYRKS